MRAAPYSAAAVFALLLALSGCVSVQDRFDKADAYESDDRLLDAARSFATVLRRDPGFPGARERLAEVGALAAERYLSEAEGHEQAGEYDEALRVLGVVEEVRGIAAEVGVVLAMPEDYAARRVRAETLARTAALDRIGDVLAAGRYDDALRRAREAERRYAMPAEDAALLRGVRAEALTGKAEAAFEDGAFRAAYGFAEDAAAFAGRGVEAQRLQVLQADALAAGTRVVAFAPVRVAGAEKGRGRTGSQDAAQSFARALDDALVYDHWTDPPLFVQPENPAAVRDALRGLRLRRGALGRREAAALGRTLGVDYVVLTDIAEIQVGQRVLHEERRAARTKRAGETPSVDTAYVYERLRLRVGATVEVRLVDPGSRAVRSTFTVDIEDDVEVDRARYAGDVATLRLPRAERALFDPARIDVAMMELVEAMAENIGHDLAPATFGELVDAIP